MYIPLGLIVLAAIVFVGVLCDKGIIFFSRKNPKLKLP